jgi:hypothetical protein
MRAIKLEITEMGRTKTSEPIAESPDLEAAPFGNLAPTFDYRETELQIDAARHFKALWGLPLKAITAGVSCLLSGIAVYSLWQMLNGSASTNLIAVLMPLVILAFCSLFTVRGYTISMNQLIVHRLGWTNAIELSNLLTAEFVPGVMHGSRRTFANGGLFAFAGNFYASDLGSYRAYVTDGMKAVVLKFTDKTIVVSPDEPEEFIAAVTSAARRGK